MTWRIHTRDMTYSRWVQGRESSHACTIPMALQWVAYKCVVVEWVRSHTCGRVCDLTHSAYARSTAPIIESCCTLPIALLWVAYACAVSCLFMVAYACAVSCLFMCVFMCHCGMRPVTYSCVRSVALTNESCCTLPMALLWGADVLVNAFKLQVSFRKRATDYRALVRKTLWRCCEVLMYVSTRSSCRSLSAKEPLIIGLLCGKHYGVAVRCWCTCPRKMSHVTHMWVRSVKPLHIMLHLSIRSVKPKTLWVVQMAHVSFKSATCVFGFNITYCTYEYVVSTHLHSVFRKRPL